MEVFCLYFLSAYDMLNTKDVLCMLKRLMTIWLCLLLMIPALAETPATLRYAYELKGLPANLSWTVYTGPGEQYHVAADGRAKVSTNEGIWCFGRVEGTDWLMIHYFIGEGKSRIGYICPSHYPNVIQGCEPLRFQQEIFSLAGSADVTDDPQLSRRTIGTVSGWVTLLAVKDGGKWAYIEGALDKSGEPVRGFIPLSGLNGAAALPELPMSPHAGDRFVLDKSYELKLPDDAKREGMTVYPLADGSWLIAYRCGVDDRLYMRVISAQGKKLWAKSVPERYLSQITLTQSGFVCQTFDNSECDSGMCYTFTCKGKKWTSRKVSWINEPDRYYADNTARFTLLRHTFGEGGEPMPIELINRANGVEAESGISAFKPFLYELEGELLLMDCWHDGLTLRRFDADLAENTNLPVPEGISAPYHVNTADHAPNAVYFFTGYGREWHMWRLDRETMRFDAEPVDIPVPQPCTLTALAANAAGTHDVLMQTDFGACFCQLTADGELLLHQSLPGVVAWITRLENGQLMLILQDGEGEFCLQYYDVCEG